MRCAKLIGMVAVVSAALAAAAEPLNVTMPLASNGRLSFWVEGFDGWNLSDYVVEWQNPVTKVWTAYPWLEAGNNSLTGNKWAGDNNSCIVSQRQDIRGMNTWRVALASVPAEEREWAVFSVDARYPIVPVSYDDYPNGYAGANRGSDTYDGRVDTYFLCNASPWKWIQANFGEDRKIAAIAYIPNAGEVVHFSYSTNAYATLECDYPLYEVPGAEALTATGQRVVLLSGAAAGNAARVYNGDPSWFSMWEIEYDEAFGVHVYDAETGCPTIGVLSGLTETGPVAVLRSKTADGAYGKVGEIAVGETYWTDVKATPGVTLWYKVAPMTSGGSYDATYSQGKPFTRAYHLERDMATSVNTLREKCSIFTLARPDGAENHWNNNCYPAMAFDGDLTTNPDHAFNWGGGWTCYNTAFGIDFGREKHHVTKCRLYSLPDWPAGRLTGLAVYGSNEELPAQTTQEDRVAFLSRGVKLSDEIGTVPQSSWVEVECDPTEGYRYIYLWNDDQDDANGWCCNTRELEFYGWGDKDSSKPGLTIFVR